MIMFPEIEGGTQMQSKKIGGAWGKKFENPCINGFTLAIYSLSRLIASYPLPYPLPAVPEFSYMYMYTSILNIH